MPKMYDELWTGGKCMYKLEPVLADGGELIIYAPHITEICVSHGKTIEETPYKKDVLKLLADECHKQGIKLFSCQRTREVGCNNVAVVEGALLRVLLGNSDQ